MRDLSDETPRRSGEARSWQVQRILGEASRGGQRVVLLIDDAHVLHHQTLRALKRLLELSWAGRSPLLGIVLLGQHDRTASIPEVGLRTDHVQLAGLSADNVSRILHYLSNASTVETFSLSEDFIRAVKDHPRARNWLDLRQLLDEALGAARADRSTVIAARHVEPDTGAQAAPVAPSGQDVDRLLDRKIPAAQKVA